MIAQKIKLLILTASCLFHFGAWANDIEPGKEFYTAIKAPNPIVLDGDLSEWRGAALLADPRFSIPKGSGDDGELVFFEIHNGGDWTGPDDHTSAVQIVYDDENVYFGFIVTDEYHENSANSAWNGDSVQLMVANDARDTQIALYNYALGGVEGDLGETIIMHEAGPGGTEAVIVRDSEIKRTFYEIKLPMASLDLTELKGGVQFGLGMAINDGDEDTPGQRGWGGLGAHSIVFGKTPEETALVTLATSNDIEPGKEFYTANPAPGEINLDGNLSDWSGIPVLSDPRFAIPKGSGRDGELVLFEEHNGGVWTGPDDHTSAVQIVYDMDNVYFGFVVTDDYHENSANSAWNGDSVQLMIANSKQDTQIALYNYALGGIEDALGEVIVMHEAGPGGTEAVVSRNTETKRTIYEIKLPKESLGLESLELGTQFGLGMAINDGDEDTPGQRGWGGLGAHSIVFGKSPSETALVTLGIGGVSGDLIFLSAISASLNTFSFRATDKGDSVVDPTTAILMIDGQPAELVAKPKVFDATDFTHTFPAPFPSNSQHTYTITLQDTNGNTITESSTFKAPIFSVLTQQMQAPTVDTSKPGFIWRVFQTDFHTWTNLDETELALAGQLIDAFGNQITENSAFNGEPFGPALGLGTVVGPADLIEFEIPTVINLSAAGEFTIVGNFDPKEQMPGVPGFSFGVNGAAAEIITFIDFPAGPTTLGVNSDDGFRMEGGYIDDPEHRQLMGEFNTTRGASDSTFLVNVRQAGIYPIRVIWFNGTDQDASIELFTVMEDGTKVLINDIENGGLPAYRSGTVPEFVEVSEPPFISYQLSAGNLVLFWEDGDGVLQQSSDLSTWSDMSNASSPFSTSLNAFPAQYFRLKR